MKTRLFLLLFPFFLWASYTGNPASPALLSKGLFGIPNPLLSLNTGYVFDFVQKRKIAPSRKPEELNLQKVTDFQIEAHLGYVGFTLLRRMETYALLGVTQEIMEWKPLQLPSLDKLKTHYHFTYAIGSKFILLDFGSTLLGIDFQYFTLPSSEKLQQKLQNIYLPLALNQQYIKWKEWHVAFGVSTKWGPLSPYLGGKYSQGVLQVKTENSLPSLRFTTETPWCVYTGISLNLSKSLYLNGEARFLGEEAYAVQMTSSF